MTETEYAPGEKKKSLNSWLLLLLCAQGVTYICFAGRLERMVLFLVTKERYPLIGYPHLDFCGLNFSSAFY